MFNLVVISETITNGYNTNFLDLSSISAILCGILVIICKNPVVSVLFLIGLFFSISSYLMLGGITFIGLSYLLVYVGAVSILFLFILMLINVRISELFSNTSNSIPLAIIISLSFTYPIYEILPSSLSTLNIHYLYNNIRNMFQNYNIDTILRSFNFDDNYDYRNSYSIFVTSKSWDGNLSESTHISSIGSIMYTSYAIWLIITSIILLLAMIGAIVITIKQK